MRLPIPFFRPLLAVIAGLTLAAPAWAETLIGTVIRVSDGDTLAVHVSNQRQVEKVRLLGVDCPEVAHGPNDPGQEPWGSRAKAFTAKLALQRQVRIETDVQPRDKYGRLLGYVYVGKTFLNLELIKAGHAVLLTYAPNVRHAEQFVQAQREARSAGRGLWNPKEQLTESPHTYRHNGHRKGGDHLVEDAIRDESKPAKAHPDGSRQQRHHRPPAPEASRGPQDGQAPQTPAATQAATVLWNRKTGKYHEPGCRYASGPTIEAAPRAQAEAEGKPCRACHPR